MGLNELEWGGDKLKTNVIITIKAGGLNRSCRNNSLMVQLPIGIPWF
jgi:hypothetical protein